jgi:hypothetical protein
MWAAAAAERKSAALARSSIRSGRFGAVEKVGGSPRRSCVAASAFDRTSEYPMLTTVHVGKLATILSVAVIFAAASVGSRAQDAAIPASTTAMTDDAVKSIALKWFADIQTGAIDRSQLTPEYSAQLSDDVVKGLAKYMQDHAYGAAPKGAEIVMTRNLTTQSVYVVKIVFPRGDAASLMLGFNPAGQITGLSLMSMAGD